MSDWIKSMGEIEGVRFTFSIYCRSGLHKDCRCERCCQQKGLQYDEERAKRDAQVADQAFKAGFALGTYPTAKKEGGGRANG